jgi:hypothetical protein
MMSEIKAIKDDITTTLCATMHVQGELDELRDKVRDKELIVKCLKGAIAYKNSELSRLEREQGIK